MFEPLEPRPQPPQFNLAHKESKHGDFDALTGPRWSTRRDRVSAHFAISNEFATDRRS